MPTKRRSTKRERTGPVRALIEICPHRSVGSAASPDSGKHPVEWESPNEQKLIYLLLLCDDVREIESQPLEVTYNFQEKTHRYTPDFRIQTPSGTRLIEAKSLVHLVRPKPLEQYLAIAEHLRSARQAIDFITDDQLNPCWFDNAFLLRRYLRHVVAPEVASGIGGSLGKAPRAIKEILEDVSQAHLIDVYALIAQRRLAIDWDQKLNREALCSVPDQPFPRMTYERIRRSGRFADLLAELALGNRPSDQRLLAASLARRRPLAPPSPLGFVGGFTPAQLSRLNAESARRAALDAGRRAKDAGSSDGAAVAGGEG